MDFFDAQDFKSQIKKLTDPHLGIVSHTEIKDITVIKSRDINADNKKPLVILTGPSRAGKDSIIRSLMTTGDFVHIKTAITRDPRPDETMDSMVWMREKREDETQDQYYAALIKEYDLIEHATHHGYVFGLPRKSLEVSSDAVRIMNTDTSGVKTLREVLSNEYKIIAIFVSPENSEQLRERLIRLSDKSEDRLRKAQEYLKAAPEVVDYVLVNRENDDVEKGIQQSALRIIALLRLLNIL